MILFSRSFIRKRVISLATTASVAATSLAMAHGPTSAHRIRGTMPLQYVADRPGSSDEAAFLSENESAMNKMMADMTGDVDRDFVAMMVPHHQGAVDMAQAELRYGHNEQLRRLAQEIVTNQQREIAVMRHAVGESSPEISQPPMPHGAMKMSHDSMSDTSMTIK
jgi:uncharacterized protein (DUF305 family)